VGCQNSVGAVTSRFRLTEGYDLSSLARLLTRDAMTADNSWGVAHKGGNQTDPVYVANLRWIGYSSQFGLPFHSHMVYALSVLDGTVKGGSLS
jgi:hypothetical protein